MESLIAFTSSLTQAYWCHQCKKEFLLKKTREDDEVFCLNCKSDFCEEVTTSENNPKNFIPYQCTQVSSQSPQNTENLVQNNTLEHRRAVLEQTFSYFSQRLLDRYIDNLILRLMLRDSSRPSRTPACKKTVEELPLIKFTKEDIEKCHFDCSVCKEDFTEEDEIKQMPCKHNFHNDCLDPWLKDHNSCPVCRFALPLENETLEKKESD